MIFKYAIYTVLLLVAESVAAATCFKPKTECVEVGGTRNIDGVDVTLDCWRYKVTYECKEKAANNCQALRDQGCSQVSATCRSTWGNTCAVQDETYSCPVERCKEAGKISCAKNIFCLDGNCATTTPTENKNFGKGASHIAALIEAAEEVRKQNSGNPRIFVGRAMECSRTLAGTKNCCKSHAEGWLQGKIMNCDKGEEELAKKKDAGLAIEVGEYCNNRVPATKICTSKHKAYCVFDTKIARIIQNDGRKNQLGISFGYVDDDSAYLDCRGITVEELSKMDFNKMDFSPLYEEIKNNAKKFPKEGYSKQKVSDHKYEELVEMSTKKIGLSQAEIGARAADRVKEHYERSKK